MGSAPMDLKSPCFHAVFTVALIALLHTIVVTPMIKYQCKDCNGVALSILAASILLAWVMFVCAQMAWLWFTNLCPQLVGGPTPEPWSEYILRLAQSTMFRSIPYLVYYAMFILLYYMDVDPSNPAAAIYSGWIGRVLLGLGTSTIVAVSVC